MERLTRLLIWAALFFLVVWVIAGRPAFANTMRGDPVICSSFSSTAYDVAQMRDAGVAWEVFDPWIQEAIQVALASPTSYVKDADDAAFIYGWFKRIFESKQEAIELAKMVEADCLKSPASFKHLRKMA